jgi:hypothetical protein
MSDKSEEFKEELLGLLEKYEVGIQGEMMFVIGEDKLMLSTRKDDPKDPDGDCPDGCDEHETCGGC